MHSTRSFSIKVDQAIFFFLPSNHDRPPIPHTPLPPIPQSPLHFNPFGTKCSLESSQRGGRWYQPSNTSPVLHALEVTILCSYQILLVAGEIIFLKVRDYFWEKAPGHNAQDWPSTQKVSPTFLPLSLRGNRVASLLPPPLPLEGISLWWVWKESSSHLSGTLSSPLLFPFPIRLSRR